MTTADDDAAIRFGTAYYPDHWPETEWARDLDQIAASGITAIRFGEFSWSWFEPRPGTFDFKAYDRFVGLAQERNLKLVLCTPTATPPPWMIVRYPDGRLIDAEGHVCQAARHFWCWHHPAARQQAEKTIRALVKHFAGHPAVVGWQIDNEPNLGESDVRTYDYNPHALAAFRLWLRAKYGDSLDALNRAWYTNFWSQRYGAWDEIGTLAFHRTNPQAHLDFLRFREAHIAGFVHWQAGLIRAADPAAFVGTNIPETGIKASLVIAQDYFAQAKGLDWVGTDVYTASGDLAADVRQMRFSCDLIRSAAGKARFLVAETQAGPHERTWPQGFAGHVFGADFLRTCVETFAEHGAAEVWLFLCRATPAGTEMGMNGLTDAGGRASPRTREVARLARQTANLPRRHARHQKRPLALMNYSRDTIRFNSFWMDSLDAMAASYAGWHSLLHDAGYRVDCVNDEGCQALAARQADLLVLPQTAIVSDEQAQQILRLAETTPILAGPHTAMLDERGHLRQEAPGAALAQRAGVALGCWQDMKVQRSVGAGVASVTASRALTVAKPGTVVLRYADAGREAAVAVGGHVVWTAFDVGMVYGRSSAVGQRKLRSLFRTWCLRAN
jgi:beta-galactosidase